MIELARHIEVLLLENDCVIIPGFGGFIAHYTSAKRIEEEKLFLPPVRTIGFNPQLKINDGLLVQSYMQTYDTNFSDATRRVEEAVNKLIGILHQEGTAEIHGIGTLQLAIDGTYRFHPNEDGVFSPSLYGLSSFEFSRLKVQEKKKEKILYLENSTKKIYRIKLDYTLLKQTVAAAAAILLFFFLSPSAENTYIEEENYAIIGSKGLFENIRDKSATSIIVQVSQKASASQKKKNAIPLHLKPKAIRIEKISRNAEKNISESPEAIQKSLIPRNKVVLNTERSKILEKAENKKNQVENKKLPEETKKIKEENHKTSYNIIVASVGNEVDAHKMANRLISQGYPQACVIKRDGKIRVSLMAISDKAEAYKTLNKIREEGIYKTAWLLTIK